MRGAAVKSTREGIHQGNAQQVMAAMPKKLEAQYQWPFQSHATMGPGCAVADIRPQGVSTVWCGTQKPHALQRGLADLMKIPLDRMRVVWVQDAGSYGRAGHEDTAADAAVLSQALGKPVRVQWMRSDMTTWGPKGPATVFDLAAGMDHDGKIQALEYTTRSFSGGEVLYQANSAGNLLAGQLMGIANTTGVDEFVQWGESTPPYRIPNLHAVAHIVPAFVPLASPLRCTHLRDPNGPSSTFAAESFVDELAAAAGHDALEFRLRHLIDDRAKAVLMAVADRAKWERRGTRSASPGSGRGVAIALRGGTYVATVAEVEVDRSVGSIRVKRIVCAHDCGLIVNPGALKGTIAANLVQATGRTLHEEVRFDRNRVTSSDWLSYPVVRAGEVPELDIILIDHPDLPSTGAGEPSSRPVAAAINNAVFDAIGVRLRTAPLTPERVKAALA
jgi:CO/xanthine dehydrogenase Mo-binding subunit